MAELKHSANVLCTRYQTMSTSTSVVAKRSCSSLDWSRSVLMLFYLPYATFYRISGGLIQMNTPCCYFNKCKHILDCFLGFITARNLVKKPLRSWKHAKCEECFDKPMQMAREARGGGKGSLSSSNECLIFSQMANPVSIIKRVRDKISGQKLPLDKISKQCSLFIVLIIIIMIIIYNLGSSPRGAQAPLPNSGCQSNLFIVIL